MTGAPRFGEMPILARTGETGYTVEQAARLLACSRGTARKLCDDGTLESPTGHVLCRASLVEAERQKRLAKLGAVEPGPGATAADPASTGDIDRLTARVVTLEEKLRLIAAARGSARDRIRNSLAEEEAYLDGMLLDVPPPS